MSDPSGELTTVPATPAGTPARRAGWSMADQCLSSATNFLLGILVARSVDRVAFGAFTLAYMAYILLVGLARSVGPEPLMIRYSVGRADDVRRAIADATGFALVFGAATGAAAVVTGAIAGGLVGSSFLALGVALPGLMLQDACRFAFFAQGYPARAALNDLIWGVAQVGAVGLAFVVAVNDPSVWSLVAAWGVSGSVAAVVGMVQLRIVPNVWRARSWLSENRFLAPSLFADFIMLIGAAQLGTYAVGVVAGLAAVGALRGGAIVLGPLTTLLTGLRLVALPESVRHHSRSPAALFRRQALLSGAGVGCAGLFLLAVMLLPHRAGVWLLGASWEPAREVLPWLTLATASAAANIGALIGLRVLLAPRRIFRTRLVVAPLVFLGVVLGAVVDDAYGAAVGLALSNWVGTCIWWRQFQLAHADRRATTSSAQEPAGPSTVLTTTGTNEGLARSVRDTGTAR